MRLSQRSCAAWDLGCSRHRMGSGMFIAVVRAVVPGPRTCGGPTGVLLSHAVPRRTQLRDTGGEHRQMCC